MVSRDTEQSARRVVTGIQTACLTQEEEKTGYEALDTGNMKLGEVALIRSSKCHEPSP